MNVELNLDTIGLGISRTVYVSGGVPPYTFEVVAGGAGGSIDAGGTYTAPSVLSQKTKDTIRVTDSDIVPTVVEKDISVQNILGLVCDIIQKEMGLANGQVYFYNEKYNIPNDKKLYVAVGFVSNKQFSNTRKFDGSGSDLNQVQISNFHAILSVTIMSRSSEAINRKEEVTMALSSVYSEQSRNANNFAIGQLPTSFLNLTYEEGASMLNAFNISIAVQYAISKIKSVPYFNNFEGPTVETEA